MQNTNVWYLKKTLQKQSNPFKNWILPILYLGALSFCVLLIVLGFDFSKQQRFAIGNIKHYFDFSPESVSNSIGVLSSIVAAVLGIVITVVSIVVQLAATRYTAAVSEIFLKDKKNRWVIGFYIISCIVGLWVAFAVQDTTVPKAGLILMLALATFCFLLMPPYFHHVFKLLSPKAIVQTIEYAIEKDLFYRKSRPSKQRQQSAMEHVETLCDIAINSIAQKDRIIAIETVDTLSRITSDYIERKNELSKEWHASTDCITKNPDFSSLAIDYLENLNQNETWFEFKIFRQYQTIYAEALGDMSIVNYEVAIQIRKNAEKAAVTAGRQDSLQLALKFLNTFLRATINKSDVRTTYTILNQYKTLAIFLLKNGHGDLVNDMANYMKYYGHIAYKKNLGFITETVAYDIGEICEIAHQCSHALEASLLSTFLDVDPSRVQGDNQESTLQGIRKAQIKLASYYLLKESPDMAKTIWEDMKGENPKRMTSIQKELRAVTTKEFWEISERGKNFDFLGEHQKSKMEEFFSWFNF